MHENDNENKYLAHEQLPTGFAVEDILAEYASEPQPPAASAERLKRQSRRIVLDAIDESVSEISFSSLDDFLEDAVGEAVREVEASRASEPKEPESAEAPDAQSDEAKEPEPEPAETEPAEAEREETPAAESEEAPEAEPESIGLDDAGGAQYASANFPERDMPVGDIDAQRREKVRRNVITPLTALLALIALRRERRSKAEARAPAEDAEEQSDPDPKRAVRLYAAQAASLRRRAKAASVFCVLAAVISYAHYAGLPLPGMLGASAAVKSAALLVIMLSVMVTGLDVFTAGLMALRRFRPGHETLCALSCIFSAIDALAAVFTGEARYGIPFCAVSSIALCFEMWGAYYTCLAYRRSFRVLASAQRLYTVTAERNASGKNSALLRSRLGAGGFIRRSEEADAAEQLYGAITPFVLLACLVLALLATAANRQGGAFLHCLSAFIAISTTFSAALCFALPYAVTARRLAVNGAALAGWTGVRDLGRSGRVVIMDEDLFPEGTVSVAVPRILENARPDKVIAYTASVLAASGCGLAPAFGRLMRSYGFGLCRVENFVPHDGGGMTAMVNGESVCVGSTGFMNLIGVRVPQKLAMKSTVFTAIGGKLVGIFEMDYRASASVRSALSLLLRSGAEPLFAVRDFNVTPLMIKEKFRLTIDKPDFPSYTERCRISGMEPRRASRVDAILTRDGMAPLVEAADRGRRLYVLSRLASAISAAGCLLGLAMMFLLFRVSAFDSASAANMTTYMLLWLVPTAAISFSLTR